jgi:S-adenosylmethionine hydrolase
MRRIALLTDFGTRDPYVAAMKGVLASRTECAVHDLTHDIAPFDIFEAAWFLRAAARWWPEGTVFVAVVDPGVGTARRMIAVDDGARIYLAPDNGVLHFIDGDAYAIENTSLFLPGGSTTFHGRDRFAPVAAAIANGTPLTELGPKIESRRGAGVSPARGPYERARRPLPSELYVDPIYQDECATGTIVVVDRFGNCITDLEAARLRFEPAACRVEGPSPVVITHLSQTYAGAGDAPFMIVGSTGCLELSAKNRSAANLLQLSRFDRVTISRS